MIADVRMAMAHALTELLKSLSVASNDALALGVLREVKSPTRMLSAIAAVAE